MLLFPAVDILSGRVVRLIRGDYTKGQVFGDSPRKAAEEFIEMGASNLHLVDLDGAKTGSPQNFEAIAEITGNTAVFTECGGGIRNETDVERYLGAGAGRVILGTSALKDKAFTKRMLERYGDRIAIGIDARSGKVSVEGWLSTSEVDSLTFCREMAGLGARYIIYTDISRDGTGQGSNLEVYRKLAEYKDIYVTASGGISTLDEIVMLKEMGIYAAIIGKAVYTGLLDLREALKLAED